MNNKRKFTDAEIAYLEQYGWGGGLSGAATGAATGAVIGSVIPGWGTAVGAIAGGLIGGVSGHLREEKMDSAQEAEKTAIKGQVANQNFWNEQSNKTFGNWTQRQYADGGQMPNNGIVQSYAGQSHMGPDGGIPVDQMGRPSAVSGGQPIAKVEDGEVLLNGYIFSNKLKPRGGKTFAKQAESVMNKYKKRLGKNFEHDDSMATEAMNAELEKISAANEQMRITKESAQNSKMFGDGKPFDPTNIGTSTPELTGPSSNINGRFANFMGSNGVQAGIGIAGMLGQMGQEYMDQEYESQDAKMLAYARANSAGIMEDGGKIKQDSTLPQVTVSGLTPREQYLNKMYADSLAAYNTNDEIAKATEKHQITRRELQRIYNSATVNGAYSSKEAELAAKNQYEHEKEGQRYLAGLQKFPNMERSVEIPIQIPYWDYNSGNNSNTPEHIESKRRWESGELMDSYIAGYAKPTKPNIYKPNKLNPRIGNIKNPISNTIQNREVSDIPNTTTMSYRRTYDKDKGGMGYMQMDRNKDGSINEQQFITPKEMFDRNVTQPNYGGGNFEDGGRITNLGNYNLPIYQNAGYLPGGGEYIPDNNRNLVPGTTSGPMWLDYLSGRSDKRYVPNSSGYTPNSLDQFAGLTAKPFNDAVGYFSDAINPMNYGEGYLNTLYQALMEAIPFTGQSEAEIQQIMDNPTPQIVEGAVNMISGYAVKGLGTQFLNKMLPKLKAGISNVKAGKPAMAEVIDPAAPPRLNAGQQSGFKLPESPKVNRLGVRTDNMLSNTKGIPETTQTGVAKTGQMTRTNPNYWDRFGQNTRVGMPQTGLTKVPKPRLNQGFTPYEDVTGIGSYTSPAAPFNVPPIPFYGGIDNSSQQAPPTQPVVGNGYDTISGPDMAQEKDFSFPPEGEIPDWPQRTGGPSITPLKSRQTTSVTTPEGLTQPVADEQKTRLEQDPFEYKSDMLGYLPAAANTIRGLFGKADKIDAGNFMLDTNISPRQYSSREAEKQVETAGYNRLRAYNPSSPHANAAQRIASDVASQDQISRIKENTFNINEGLAQRADELNMRSRGINNQTRLGIMDINDRNEAAKDNLTTTGLEQFTTQSQMNKQDRNTRAMIHGMYAPYHEVPYGTQDPNGLKPGEMIGGRSSATPYSKIPNQLPQNDQSPILPNPWETQQAIPNTGNNETSITPIAPIQENNLVTEENYKPDPKTLEYLEKAGVDLSAVTIQPAQGYDATDQNNDYMINEGSNINKQGIHTSYQDTTGNDTIGYGHKLTESEIESGKYKDGITEQQARALLDKDVKKHSTELYSNYKWAQKAPPKVRKALEDMYFNMGGTNFGTFKNTLKLIENGDYEKAADNIMKSKYARQVGKRAERNAELIRKAGK